MTEISQKAYARAGLLGNPSDGYNGKTISLIVKNFFAQVTLTPSKRLAFVLPESESNSFDSIEKLTSVVQSQGYYGGTRLLKAAVKRFYEHCQLAGHRLHADNFTLAFRSNIPRQVGLAGSSAIVTATLRVLMEWYQIEIPPHLLASLTLSAEADLGIPAGLQDRVIQAFEGIVYMDFAPNQMKEQHELSYGAYEPLPIPPDLNLYIAYTLSAGEPTEVIHNDLRKRFNEGEVVVVNAMKEFAELAEQGRQALIESNDEVLFELIDRNFDLRQSICSLHPEHQRLVETARSCGASAKYCGSGGAIVGTYTDDGMYQRLNEQMKQRGYEVLKPTIN